MEEINKAYATFRERDRIASLGGGVEKIEKQHESGKMTARERIEMLLDKGTFVELDKLMVHRCTNYGMDKNKIPGDGIVSGYGKIDGRQVFVYAYDFTVYGGSLSASNAKKIVKVQQLALKNGAPIIALNDSGGARIQEGIESLSGYADIFYQNTMASGVIPQISAILGPCAGGACYSPALTDFIFMVKEKSHMFVTGPDVVKTVIHEEVSKEELGGAMTHSSKSGVTHFMCNTEEELLMSIRELLSFLPQNNMDETKKQNCTDETNREDAVLDTIVPADPMFGYYGSVIVGVIFQYDAFYCHHCSCCIASKVEDEVQVGDVKPRHIAFPETDRLVGNQWRFAFEIVDFIFCGINQLHRHIRMVDCRSQDDGEIVILSGIGCDVRLYRHLCLPGLTGCFGQCYCVCTVNQ